ncbi:MAG: hypothetical protein JRG95_25225 [Deltaproteobacteria bacterium]|nr:hypothetical protein [Deltaproteobacteria bacterium]
MGTVNYNYGYHSLDDIALAVKQSRRERFRDHTELVINPREAGVGFAKKLSKPVANLTSEEKLTAFNMALLDQHRRHHPGD